MNDIKFKIALPFIAVALTVFIGVATSFVCYGVFNSNKENDNSYKDVEKYRRKNIFVSVKNAATGTLDVNISVVFNPKNNTIKMISIPPNTHVKVASSDQMFKNLVNIGGTDMLRSTIEKVIPVPVDYHMIINNEDLYCQDGDYYGLIKNTFSSYLWQKEDLNGYLNEILKISNTDLTLFKTEEYSQFLNIFRNCMVEAYTVEGVNVLIDERIFYEVNHLLTNKLINASILN